MNKLDGAKSKATSTELIIYQLGEVKNLVGNLGTEFTAYRKDNDNRISILEKFMVAQSIINENTKTNAKDEPVKFDSQKIILALIAALSSAIAVALGLIK